MLFAPDTSREHFGIASWTTGRRQRHNPRPMFHVKYRRPQGSVGSAGIVEGRAIHVSMYVKTDAAPTSPGDAGVCGDPLGGRSVWWRRSKSERVGGRTLVSEMQWQRGVGPLPSSLAEPPVEFSLRSPCSSQVCTSRSENTSGTPPTTELATHVFEEGARRRRSVSIQRCSSRMEPIANRRVFHRIAPDHLPGVAASGQASGRPRIHADAQRHPFGAPQVRSARDTEAADRIAIATVRGADPQGPVTRPSAPPTRLAAKTSSCLIMTQGTGVLTRGPDPSRTCRRSRATRCGSVSKDECLKEWALRGNTGAPRKAGRTRRNLGRDEEPKSRRNSHIAG